MLNAVDVPKTDPLRVVQYDNATVADRMAHGRMNTDAETILSNIRAAVRRGHPQMKPGPLRPDRVCLVGSGPSLPDTLAELRQLIWDGAALVTVNGAYHWCLAHNLRPQTQIVMDARPMNARFLTPYVPKCNYVLASQCAPTLWDAVASYPDVWIFHAVVKGEEDASPILDAYYAGNWIGTGGGTTVVSRAIHLLRQMGYLRFDLFGVDCSWSGESHHALEQPENAGETYFTVRAGALDRPETMRAFRVSTWMLKQAEDLLTQINVNGRHFRIAAHGDGLFAYLLRTLGASDTVTLTKE